MQHQAIEGEVMTNRFTRRALAITGGAALAVLAALAPQAASADTPEPEAPETVSVTMPMTVVGYDEEVAEANGFQIVTNPDGSQSSIPVTDEAKALVADAPDVSARDTVVGDCGQSWLNGSKGANDTVSFTTGYSVRAAVVLHQWRVQAIGFITSGEKNYAQGAGGAVWSTSGSTQAIGPGYAIVPPLSPVAMVKLVDGATCYSGGPSFTFG
jgi:hypothetical protein